jgi:hypothetical protein
MTSLMKYIKYTEFLVRATQSGDVYYIVLYEISMQFLLYVVLGIQHGFYMNLILYAK